MAAVPWLQTIEAPSLSAIPVARSFRARSFADILGSVGFADSVRLTERVSRWRKIINTVSADVVLPNFSPFVCFAAKGLVPTISVGSGFATPPTDVDAFPVLNELVAPSYREVDLLHTANEVAEQCDLDQKGKTLLALTAADEALIHSYPMFDPYNGTGHRPTFGPIEDTPQVQGRDWPNRFYAYLAGDDAGTPRLIEAFKRSEIGGQVYVSSAAKRSANDVNQNGLQRLTTIPKLTEILPTVSLVIHHAGVGIAQTVAFRWDSTVGDSTALGAGTDSRQHSEEQDGCMFDSSFHAR